MSLLINSAYSKYWNPKIIKDSVNAETLGYVLKNGHVNYLSHEKALEVARKRILSALNSSEPYERGIIVKGSQITADIKGEHNCVKFPQDEMKDGICLHGHIQSTPISLQDYFIMLLGKAKEIIAINPNGEYSKLTRLDEPVWMQKIPKRFGNFISELQTRYRIKHFNKQYRTLMRSIDKNINIETDSIVNQIRTILSKSDSATIQKITKCIKDFQSKGTFDTTGLSEDVKKVMENWKKLDEFEVKAKIPIIDEFWTTHSPEELGATYSTDYSGIILN